MSTEMPNAGDGQGSDASRPRAAYVGLASEYDALQGDLAEQTWRQGILVDLERIGVPPEATVLDLGAGTGAGGRLMETHVKLRRIGLDNSPTMLHQAGAWYETTLEADLCEIPLPRAHVDFAVAGFGTLNYLDGEQLGRCLAAVARVLKPGGWLVFDYSSPHLLSEQWRDHQHVDPLPDGALHGHHRYNEIGQCVTTLTRLDQSGAIRWTEHHVRYALDTFVLHRLATHVGLTVERVRDLHRAEFSPASKTHVWSMQRRQVG